MAGAVGAELAALIGLIAASTSAWVLPDCAAWRF
jgi:hypothetical protein